MRSTALVIGACLALAPPAHAVTRYELAGTLEADLISWAAGTSIAFTGLLTDPTLLPGGEKPASEIEIPELAIGDVEQTGVQAFVTVSTGDITQLSFFVSFDGANNPDLSVLVNLPPDAGDAFPEITFDLDDPAVSIGNAELNEDGIEPQPVAVTSATGVVLPEPGAAASAGAVATGLALARRRRDRVLR